MRSFKRLHSPHTSEGPTVGTPPPPFDVGTPVHYLGATDGSSFHANVKVGAKGVVIEMVCGGRQGTAKPVLSDALGDINDVTVDGYSIVLFDGDMRVAVTQEDAKYFEVGEQPTSSPEFG